MTGEKFSGRRSRDLRTDSVLLVKVGCWFMCVMAAIKFESVDLEAHGCRAQLGRMSLGDQLLLDIAPRQEGRHIYARVLGQTHHP